MVASNVAIVQLALLLSVQDVSGLSEVMAILTGDFLAFLRHWYDDTGKEHRNTLKRSLSKHRFVHHKYHVGWSVSNMDLNSQKWATSCLKHAFCFKPLTSLQCVIELCFRFHIMALYHVHYLRTALNSSRKYPWTFSSSLGTTIFLKENNFDFLFYS